LFYGRYRNKQWFSFGRNRKGLSGKTICKAKDSLTKMYKHQEVFLYNYKKNLWRKYYKKGKEIVFEETAYSKILLLNLSNLLVLSK